MGGGAAAYINFGKMDFAILLSAFRPKADVNQRCSELPFIAEGVEQLLKMAFSAGVGEHRQIGELLSH